MMIKRLVRHLASTGWRTRQCFPPSVLHRLAQQVAASEAQHRGQLRFVIESALDWPAIWHRQTARQRALEWFGQLGVWDTEDNTGVLVYVLMAERKIEIIADRGIANRVSAAAWQSICQGMQQSFAAGRFVSGLEEGMQQLHALLVQHVPNQGAKGPNELPDEIVLR